MARLPILVLAGLIGLAPALIAQNSIYGVRGIGFPGQPFSVRARALGGGWAPFDQFSPQNPAATASFTALSVSASYGLTTRNYSIDTTSVSGLVENRFPVAILGGNMGRTPLSFSISFSTYAERTYSLTTTGSGMVGGEIVQTQDRIASDGGIVDARGTVGWRVSPSLSLGGALHLINGSSRITAHREFIDTDLVAFDVDSDLSFSGIGASAGLIWRGSGGRIQFALAGRWDNRLQAEIDNTVQSEVDLPLAGTAGLSLAITSSLRWSTGATWRGWNVSTTTSSGATGADVQAFDTWNVGTGLEIGSFTARFPVRLGARYATLPFAVSAQPHELVLAAGTGSRFAAGRGTLNVTIERLMRDGAGARERGWHLTLGITVQP